MSSEMSPQARATLVDHLEAVLCDSNTLRDHLAHLGRLQVEPSLEWDEELLEQLVHDPCCLELLENNELQRLNHDPATLIALSDEILRDWRPAWTEPLALVGRAWRERTEFVVPSWSDIQEVHPEDSFASSDAELEIPLASFGHALGEPFEKKGRALLLNWEWSRSRRQLEAHNPNSNLSRAEARGRVNFRIQAYATREKRLGCWMLTLSGDLSKSHSVTLNVVLKGWSKSFSDTSSFDLLHTAPTQIALTQFPDPTGVFADNANDGKADAVLTFSGCCNWQLAEQIPGPSVDRAFYEAWCSDELNPNGLDHCIARLRAIVGRKGPVKDQDLVHDALVNATQEIVRRRYVYRDINSYEDFAKMVFECALKGYSRMHGHPVTKSEFDDLADPRPKTDSLELQELQQALKTARTQLSPPERQVFELYCDSGFKISEIAERTGIRTHRVRTLLCSAIKKLRKILGDNGLDPNDLFGPR